MKGAGLEVIERVRLHQECSNKADQLGGVSMHGGLRTAI